MIKVFLLKLKHGQNGITGLETAIILIAFVVVAAVFAYAILSAGLYSSQKSKEAVYQGVEEARCATSLNGAVIAKAEDVSGTFYISQFTFTLKNTMGGEPNDFTPPLTSGNDGKAPNGGPNKVVISYFDPYQKIDDLFWTLNILGKSDSDNLLEADEQFQITIGADNSFLNSSAGSGNLIDCLTTRLGPDTKFTIEVKTPSGSTLTFERTTPPGLTPVINLN
jgi:archaeal flagellin FlaB